MCIFYTCVYYARICRYIYIYIYTHHGSWYLCLISVGIIHCSSLRDSPGIHLGDQWYREWRVCPGATAPKGALRISWAWGDQITAQKNLTTLFFCFSISEHIISWGYQHCFSVFYLWTWLKHDEHAHAPCRVLMVNIANQRQFLSFLLSPDIRTLPSTIAVDLPHHGGLL